MPEPPPQPPRRAVALRYEPGAPAPKVTATGAGLVAERIVAAAKEAGVPIRSDPALAEALARLELDADVPEAMWVAVAETLAWAYRLDAQARGRRRPG
ncbi:MAG TPA: EscU/YscU/HrcU family type III secretion system export apparatus switch protein [Solirubrobacteraceae bacterium]|nr:EscU/YscU/HrcU family type III secretion system export apparatus switch protein [Solirubrobacteraceae bacterium]